MINKLKNKRGQVVYFAVIGVIIFFTIALFLFVLPVRLWGGGEGGKLDPSTEPLKYEVRSCLADISDNALDLLGSQGGKIYLREGEYMQLNNEKIFYLAKHSQSLFDILNMEQELSRYLEENIKECVKNNFISKQLTLKQGNLKPITTIIKKDQVIFGVNWDLTLIKDGKNYKEDDEFEYKTPKDPEDTKRARLGLIRELAKEIVNQVCVVNSQTGNLPESPEGVKISYYDYGKDTIYTIKDNKYFFRFAVENCLAKQPGK